MLSAHNQNPSLRDSKYTQEFLLILRFCSPVEPYQVVDMFKSLMVLSGSTSTGVLNNALPGLGKTFVTIGVIACFAFAFNSVKKYCSISDKHGAANRLAWKSMKGSLWPGGRPGLASCSTGW